MKLVKATKSVKRVEKVVNAKIVTTKLSLDDRIGAVKARLGINRMNYQIEPGLYRIGRPDAQALVLVTANYKLTFDALRKELSGIDAWLLVLDTQGINVWCAAGKGTFGTEELERRINSTKLHQVVSHRKLILPQLGAPGISAHEITKNTGFKVIYGPVKAADIKAFIQADMNATTKMRTVKFTMYDRLVLTPMELVGSLKIALGIFGVLFLINLIAVNPFGLIDFYAFIGAILAGCVITPMFLPWIPGRAFAWKGWIVGLIWMGLLFLYNNRLQGSEMSLIRLFGYLLVFPSLSAFLAMNFTGSSTYTSFSGVLKEMKIAVPLMLVSVFLGIVFVLLNSFIGI